MNNQQVILTTVLTAILSGYTGWLYARKVDPYSHGTIQIHGLARMEVPPSPDGTELEQQTPTMAVAKCKLKRFQIDSATDGMEQAVVRLSDISAREFQCLLDEAQVEVSGEPQPNPLSNRASGPSYRPLYMTFEPVNQNAQTH
ncbi:hypothetical protein [Novosphingobium taihuense]|uniref:Uncharacterized protein n=1 Tax=Novosphingobium taihuense TaxID=260085 RepID=A0A7W7ET60_9SPHN|nr:hypothetical protein [Novosphingobium taihuense]MBB4612649.1 hypothetical protein [Novosphingobium taihuense]